MHTGSPPPAFAFPRPLLASSTFDRLSRTPGREEGENPAQPATFSSGMDSSWARPPPTGAPRVPTAPQHPRCPPASPSQAWLLRAYLGQKEPKDDPHLRAPPTLRTAPPTRRRFKGPGWPTRAQRPSPLPPPAQAAPTWGRCARTYFSRGGRGRFKRGRDCTAAVAAGVSPGVAGWVCRRLAAEIRVSAGRRGRAAERPREARAEARTGAAGPRRGEASAARWLRAATEVGSVSPVSPRPSPPGPHRCPARQAGAGGCPVASRCLAALGSSGRRRASAARIGPRRSPYHGLEGGR